MGQQHTIGQGLHQPQALVGNPVSDAYFAALRRAGRTATPTCAHCGADLSNAVRVSDGDKVWCDASHQTLWARRESNRELARDLASRGWTADRWAARRG